MDEKKYIGSLENVIKQMLKPLKDVPFNLVISSLANKEVIPFDIKNKEHKKVLDMLKKIALEAGQSINKQGILRKRANEVGNDIEKYVKTALLDNNIHADIPKSKKGTKKSTGYPDILFFYEENPYYLECKTFNIDNISTSLRSFYLSPSENSKISYSAPHLMISFEIYEAGQQKGNHLYKCKSYKIISLESLSLDVKYEFNSDNKRMYSGKDGTHILAEGKIN